MKELRDLLLDCRSALRRADRGFDDSPLRARLDHTIIGMSQASPEPEDDAVEPQTFSAQQVAYAWQQAARELHFTHPALYAELGKQVRERLQADELLDPGVEIVQVQAQLRAAEAVHEGSRAELTALHAILANAVLLEGTDAVGSDADCAQRRLRLLLNAATHGGALPRPRPEDPDAIEPTREELQLVSRGQREFSQEEREWCIGEAVVRSHFECDPAQLLAAGDQALATLILGDGKLVA
ncbi:MAG TPA: hypothetical protein VHF02_01010 [Luteimonas sp.]|nr:hypothetical protein [Luteimonas sp.]